MTCSSRSISLGRAEEDLRAVVHDEHAARQRDERPHDVLDADDRDALRRERRSSSVDGRRRYRPGSDRRTARRAGAPSGWWRAPLRSSAASWSYTGISEAASRAFQRLAARPRASWARRRRDVVRARARLAPAAVAARRRTCSRAPSASPADGRLLERAREAEAAARGGCSARGDSPRRQQRPRRRSPRTCPPRTSNSVVLPAPFGPAMPSTSPAPTTKETPSTARRPP